MNQVRTVPGTRSCVRVDLGATILPPIEPISVAGRKQILMRDTVSGFRNEEAKCELSSFFALMQGNPVRNRCADRRESKKMAHGNDLPNRLHDNITSLSESLIGDQHGCALS